MAKYSTGSSKNNKNIDSDSNICELCGSSEDLYKTNVSGTMVFACNTCRQNHGSKDNTDKKSSDKSDKETDTKLNDISENKETWHKYATTAEPDNEWVEKTRPDYGNVKTPYLVNKYGEKLEKSLYDKQISKKELANRVNIDIEIIEHILNSEAIRNDVSKKQISKIENELNIKLQE